jgi:membrane associated rhomboid family serine protease
MFAMTPWVRRLLIANVVVFIASASLPALYYEFALVPALLLQRPWTGVTYMFLHAGLGHLFFNMIALFFFGPRLEQRLGARDFLWLYFLSGFGGAAFSFLFAPQYPVVGASGAVYGVLLAFAMFWPRERIYIWAILPVEAWLLAAIMVGASLWSGIAGSQSGVAHFAHLGGLAFGFTYLKARDWRRGSARREFQQKLNAATGGGQAGGTGPAVLQDRTALKRWEAIPVDALHELNRDEVAVLLEKARTLGVRGLTASERQFLDRMAATTGQ